MILHNLMLNIDKKSKSSIMVLTKLELHPVTQEETKMRIGQLVIRAGLGLLAAVLVASITFFIYDSYRVFMYNSHMNQARTHLAYFDQSAETRPGGTDRALVELYEAGDNLVQASYYAPVTGHEPDDVAEKIVAYLADRNAEVDNPSLHLLLVEMQGKLKNLKKSPSD